MRDSYLADTIEAMTSCILTTDLREQLVDGADALDLVRSGLDDTERLASQEISKTKRDNPLLLVIFEPQYAAVI